MADIQHDLDVPHRVNIDGQTVEIAEFQARVYCSCEPDGWTIESAAVDGLGEDGKRRMIDVPRQSPLWQSILDAAAHPTPSEALDDKWSDFMWEHRRFRQPIDIDEHGTHWRSI